MKNSTKTFISADKLSKKEKRKLNNEKRVVWAINPVTRKPENPKAYNRAKEKKNLKCFY